MIHGMVRAPLYMYACMYLLLILETKNVTRDQKDHFWDRGVTWFPQLYDSFRFLNKKVYLF